ncbi:MAG TPA: MmcQ/YjbR family DNA-binding protein [Planctomycetaceae bacterium]|nr:MmcQ/YjbR family DNA-binding protein [Planctomycetaceae bacterium]
MTADQFRRLALGLPGVSENAHMGHPDFRVGGKIFATLGAPDEAWGMVKLTPEQQRRFMGEDPKIFVPANGAWGKQGCTYVCLKAATKAKVSTAMVAAWRNRAPEELLEDQSG